MRRNPVQADLKPSTAVALSRGDASSSVVAVDSSSREQLKSTAGSTYDRLRALRVQQGLTTRHVADLSHQIALSVGRKDFGLSHARLLQIENGESTPSIYKLFSLSVIYGTSIAKLLSLYIEPEVSSKCQLELRSPNTHLIDTDLPADETIEFPIEFTPAASESQTTFITELVSLWGHVPAVLLARVNRRQCRYGVIGLSDYTMYPLLRPGSFVRIERPKKWNRGGSYSNEYQRPIYFIEHRTGYICSWCEVHGNRLLSIPHPLSPCSTREFEYPDEAEIAGLVTAIAVPLTEVQAGPPGPNAAGAAHRQVG